MGAVQDFRDHLDATAFAFRGYNVTNLGRTAELLEVPRYAPFLVAALRETGDICAECLGRPVDLIQRVRDRRETVDLSTYAEDVALIVGVELAQLKILDEFFGVKLAQARMCYGYSLGEATAVAASGIFPVRDMLRPPLTLAADVVALAEGVTLGVVFSRGRELNIPAVEKLCLAISQRGQGTIAISSILAPNTVLALGQGETLDAFKQEMATAVGPACHLRKNPNRWPPLHTPIMWQRNIPNRAALMMQTVPGGFAAPRPPVLSMVTGKFSYNDHNSRDLLNQWVDHPQRLWDAIQETLSLGIETVVHVGPEPNLIPATFKRLSDNVGSQLAGRSLASYGLRAVSQIARRPWLTNLLTSRTALLRAPFVAQVNLEDWLLERAADR